MIKLTLHALQPPAFTWIAAVKNRQILQRKIPLPAFHKVNNIMDIAINPNWKMVQCRNEITFKFKKVIVNFLYFIFISIRCTVHLLLFCTITNKCTTISQIISILHVSTLSCHPQGASNQYLAKLHKYFKCSCW